MSSFYATMWAYPWDLHDEGAETVLRCIREDAGMNAVSLAAAYHSFEMLRPHLPQRNLLQIPRAAVYFQPQEALYRDTRLRPVVSPLMDRANWYAEAAEAAGRVGIDLVAWTVFLHTSSLAGQYPECAEMACTGDVRTHHLCPSNPDVRAYACALAKDLVQNYGIAALECESLNFGGFGHTHYHVKYGVELGEGGRFLFSLCFCPSCRAAARAEGVDADALAEMCHGRIGQALAAGQSISESSETLVQSVTGLAQYLKIRQRTVTSLFDAVKAAAGVPTRFILMGAPHISGVNRRAIAAMADCVEILSYSADAGRTRQAVETLLPDLPGPDRLMVGLQTYPPASPDAGALCENVRTAAALGVRRFSFYNYGIMPLPNLDWVKKAI